jgi:hypothetical protein
MSYLPFIISVDHPVIYDEEYTPMTVSVMLDILLRFSRILLCMKLTVTLWDNSASIEMGYGLDGRGSIPG